MCTVTIVPWTDGFRLVCNRDEARTRTLALPPRIVDGDVRSVMPIDPESGGTWIAATEKGLGFAVLNLNLLPPPAALPGSHSRGTIIPKLLACGSVEEAVATLGQLVLTGYRPFRLVVASVTTVAEVRQAHPGITTFHLAGPLMFTSSGLGDHLVERPRRELFETLMSGDGSLVEKQDRFHAHRWPSRPHISVNMERAEASTVSRTVLEIGRSRVHVEYVAAGQDDVKTAGIYRFQSNR